MKITDRFRRTTYLGGMGLVFALLLTAQTAEAQLTTKITGTAAPAPGNQPDILATFQITITNTGPGLSGTNGEVSQVLIQAPAASNVLIDTSASSSGCVQTPANNNILSCGGAATALSLGSSISYTLVLTLPGNSYPYGISPTFTTYGDLNGSSAQYYENFGSITVPATLPGPNDTDGPLPLWAYGLLALAMFFIAKRQMFRPKTLA